MSTVASPLTTMERILPWALRLALLLQPFTVGELITRWLGDAASSTERFGSVVFWVVWSVAMLASFVALPVTLTFLRIVTPIAVVASLWAGIDLGDASVAILAAVSSVVSTALAFHPIVGDTLVNGASYGDERRFLLRYPGQLLMGPLPLTWAALVLGIFAGPLLLVTHRWLVGLIVTAAGAVIATVSWRALHALHCRWTVMVPAGFVLHDPMSVREPVLFGRTDIVRIGPAPAEFSGLDLTNVSLGLAVRAELRTATQMYLARGDGGATDVESFAFAPTRPGALVREASARRLPIG